MAGDTQEAPPPVWHGLVAGAASSVLSRLVTYPLDTVKARLQVQGALSGGGPQGRPWYTSTTNAVATIMRVEGPAALYRGFVAVAAGAVPATAAYYGGYELGQRMLPKGESFPGGRAGRDMAVGLIAQLIAGVAFTPVDVVKERVQVSPLLQRGPGGRASALEVARQLLAVRGGRGLLTGYWVTNGVWIPWNIVYIAVYEEAKRDVAAVLGAPSPSALPGWAVGTASFGAAAAAALVTAPLDVVKTRLQVLSAGGGLPLRTLDVARLLVQTEGWRAFGSGVGARVLTIAPGAALSWACYESIKRWLGGQHTGEGQGWS